MIIIFKHKIRTLHQILGTQLKIISALLENYPFELPIDTLWKFTELQANYQSIAITYQQEEDACNLQNTISACVEQYKKQKAYLETGLKMDLVSREESISSTAKTLKEALDLLDKVLDYLNHSAFNPQGVEAHYQSVKTEIETKWDALKTELQAFVQSVCTQETLARLKEEKLYLERELSAETWQLAKWYQHAILLLQSRLQDFRPWLESSSSLQVALPNTWQNPPSYKDLLVVIHLLKPECVITGLEREQAILAHAHQKVEAAILALKERHGPALNDWVRAKATLMLYEKWENILHQLEIRLQKSPELSAFQKICLVENAFTYDKKKCFQIYLTQQRFFDLIFTLQRQGRLTPTLQELQKTQYQLKARILKRETALKASFSRSNRLLATIWVGVTHQPDFELGQWLANTTLKQLDQYPQIPILGTQLPPELAQRTTQVIGLACLGLSLYVSNYIGYSYHLMASFNRWMLANPESTWKIGRLLEKHFVPLFKSYLKKYPEWYSKLRWDEIGCLEKETQINWFCGLLMNGVLTARYSPKIGAVSYLFATTATRSAQAHLQTLLAEYDLSQDAKIFSQVVVHALVYTFAYKQAIHWMSPSTPASQTKLDQSEALNRLGFFKAPEDTKIIKRRYYEMAKTFHPDQCILPQEECHEKMVELNEAYTSLTKGK